MNLEMEVECGPEPTRTERTTVIYIKAMDALKHQEEAAGITKLEAVADLKQKERHGALEGTKGKISVLKPNLLHGERECTKYRVILPNPSTTTSECRVLPPENSSENPSTTTNEHSNTPPLGNSSVNTSIETASIKILPAAPTSVPLLSVGTGSTTTAWTEEPFVSQSCTPQNSPIMALGPLVSSSFSPGIVPGTPLLNSSFSPGIVPGTLNSTIPILNNGYKLTVTPASSGVRDTVVGISIPSYTPITLRDVASLDTSTPLPLPPAVPRHSFNVRWLPGNVSIQTSVPQKTVSTSQPCLGTTSSTKSSNSPRFTIRGPKQPQRFLAKTKNLVSNTIPTYKKLKVIPISDIIAPKKSTQPHNTVADKMDKSSTVTRFPAIVPNSFPKPVKTREVVTPRIQPDGTVRMEKTIITYYKKQNCDSRNVYKLLEVSNNPLETGVAKKFVVHQIGSQEVDQVRKKVLPTSGQVGNVESVLSDHNYGTSQKDKHPLTFVKTIKKYSGPLSPSSTEQPEMDPQRPTDSPRAVQWHHPCTGEPPSTDHKAKATGDSVNEDDPVSISDDDDNQPASRQLPVPEVSRTDNMTVVDEQPTLTPPGVSETKNEPGCISGDDDHSAPEGNGHISIPVDDDGLFESEGLTVSNSSVLKYHRSDAQEDWTDKHVIGAPSAEGKSEISKKPITSTTTQTQSPHSVLKIKLFNKNNEFGAERELQPTGVVRCKKKKSKKEKLLEKKKKRKARLRQKCSLPCSHYSVVPEVPPSISGTSDASTSSLKVHDQRDTLDSETGIGKFVNPSPPPMSPSANNDLSCAEASETRAYESKFTWHHPYAEDREGKPAEESILTGNSGFETGRDFESEQAHVSPPLLQSSKLNHVAIEDGGESKYLPCSSSAELGTNNQESTISIDPDSIHSLDIRTNSPVQVKYEEHSSNKPEGDFPANRVFDDDLEDICSVDNVPSKTATPNLRCQQKERLDKFLNELQRRLKRRCKLKSEGIKTSSVTTPLKRALVRGPDKNPRKKSKITSLPTSSPGSSKRYEQKREDLKPDTVLTDQKESVWEKTANVLRGCIVRKAIQDCYSKGVIPTADKIHNACHESGMELPKHSIGHHLTSIGYNWVECDSKMLPVEDHKLINERIKYLKKIEKYRGRNLVYIFVSDYVRKDENGWEVVLNDVDSPYIDSALVALHAMSNKSLLSGGLEVLKVGMCGLRQDDIAAWLKCKVLPEIPEGSVIILANHPVFDKNEELGEKPDIRNTKESIITWLANHKVTSVNPNSPKAVLLSKVAHVILPKTSLFDKIIRQNGFISLHLPKYHKDLNPIEFLWHDILDKVSQNPGVKSDEDFEGFISQEFASCSLTVSSVVACNLVEKFECSYREFDLRFDEFFEKVTPPSVANKPLITDAVPEKTGQPGHSGQPDLSACLVCLSRTKLQGSWRCSSCKTFWKRLCAKFRKGPFFLAALPVCRDKDHVATRPPECNGCRRFRYEQGLMQQPYTVNKLPNFHLPIPPVTEEGKPYSPSVVSRKKTKKLLNKSSSSCKRKRL